MIVNVKYGKLRGPSNQASKPSDQGQASAFGASLGIIGTWLLSGPGHRAPDRQSYGEMQRRLREYQSSQYQSSLHSGVARQYSTYANYKEEMHRDYMNQRAHGMTRPADLGFAERGLAFNPWQSAQTRLDNGWNMSRKQNAAESGSWMSQIRQRGKNINSKNRNYEQVLKRSEGPDKGSGNSAVMQEMYSTAETRNSGFSSKDFTSDSYQKNFAALALDKGTNRLDPALKDMYSEKRYLADTGLVRRKPRWGYL